MDVCHSFNLGHLKMEEITSLFQANVKLEKAHTALARNIRSGLESRAISDMLQVLQFILDNAEWKDINVERS